MEKQRKSDLPAKCDCSKFYSIKVAARHPGIAAPRDAFDDEEEMIDDGDGDEPDDELTIKAQAAQCGCPSPIRWTSRRPQSQWTPRAGGVLLCFSRVAAYC